MIIPHSLVTWTHARCHFNAHHQNPEIRKSLIVKSWNITMHKWFLRVLEVGIFWWLGSPSFSIFSVLISRGVHCLFSLPWMICPCHCMCPCHHLSGSRNVARVNHAFKILTYGMRFDWIFDTERVPDFRGETIEKNNVGIGRVFVHKKLHCAQK